MKNSLYFGIYVALQMLNGEVVLDPFAIPRKKIENLNKGEKLIW